MNERDDLRERAQRLIDVDPDYITAASWQEFVGELLAALGGPNPSSGQKLIDVNGTRDEARACLRNWTDADIADYLAVALRPGAHPLTWVKNLVVEEHNRRALGGPSGAEDGAALIVTERRRQVDREGWTPEHDDEHWDGALADAALWYIDAAQGGDMRADETLPDVPSFGIDWFKPTEPVRNLVKAGALVAAEIDRLIRAAEGRASTVRTVSRDERDRAVESTLCRVRGAGGIGDTVPCSAGHWCCDERDPHHDHFLTTAECPRWACTARREGRSVTGPAEPPTCPECGRPAEGRSVHPGKERLHWCPLDHEWEVPS